MDRIVTVFCSGPEQTTLSNGFNTLSRYPGFVVVQWGLPVPEKTGVTH
jgi:hypothetical protein